MAATCKSCNAPILWAKSDKSRQLMPLDAEPSADGNILLDLDGAGRYAVLPAAEAAAMRAAGNPLYTSHFATCPDHAKFRKPRA